MTDSICIQDNNIKLNNFESTVTCPNKYRANTPRVTLKKLKM